MNNLERFAVETYVEETKRWQSMARELAEALRELYRLNGYVQEKGIALKALQKFDALSKR